MTTEFSQEGTIKEQSAALALIFAIFYLNMLSRLGLAPLLPGIATEFSLTHAEAGAMFFFVSMGYGIGLFSSSIISARLSHHHLIALSSIIVGASLITLSFCDSLWSLRIWLMVLGFSGGLYLPSGVAVVTSLVRSKDWGKALAIHQLAPNLAYFCSPLLADLILDGFSWRIAVVVYGTASIVMGGIFFQFARFGSNYGEIPSFKLIRRLVVNPTFPIMILLFSLALAVNQGVFSIMPLYLTSERQMEYGLANQLLSLSRLIAFGMPLLAGWASDKYGLKKTLYIVVAVNSLATFLVALVPGLWIAPGLILQAVASVCFFPLGFAVLSHIMPKQSRNIAVAFIVPIGHLLGAGMVPTLIGLAGDIGSFSWGFGALGLITVMGLFLMRYLPSSLD